MALYNLDVQKVLGGEYWTNRYVLEGDSIPELLAPATAIWQAEQAITCAPVTFVSYRISDRIEGSDVYRVVTIGLPGLRTITLDTMMPLFNVARVLFEPATGRPSSKLLRGVLGEGDCDSAGLVNSSLQTFVNTNYTAYLIDTPSYVDVDGQPFVDGHVDRRVGMRQLRRGSKRRETPVIPVA